MRCRMCFLLLFLLAGVCDAWGQYDIKVKVKQMAGQKVMLACYMEDKLYVQDTVILDKAGEGHFRNDKKKLSRGLYVFYITPSCNLEMIIGDKQQFSIQCDTLDIINGTKIEGAPENIAFLDFQRFMIELNRKSHQLREEYDKNPDKEKEEVKADYSARYDEMDKEVRAYVKDLVQKYPGSALATFVDFTIPPSIPDFSKEVPEGTKDREMEIRRRSYFYYKNHYWDHTNFADSTLILTKDFKKQLNNYFDNLVVVHPDSLYNACVEILEKSRPCKAMFKYLMDYCTLYTFNNKIMGMDEAFVKLGERYYLSNIVDWVGKEQMKTIRDEVLKRMYNLLYHPAVELKLPTLDGKWVSLQETKAPFTVMVFWEPNCGHCKTQVPLLKKEILDRFAPYGLKVFSVQTQGDKKAGEEFVEKHELFDFINCWDPGDQSNYRSYYNVFSTPVMYILDKDKKFIAKNLAVDQMVDLLKNEYKKQGIDIK